MPISSEAGYAPYCIRNVSASGSSSAHTTARMLQANEHIVNVEQLSLSGVAGMLEEQKIGEIRPLEVWEQLHKCSDWFRVTHGADHIGPKPVDDLPWLHLAGPLRRWDWSDRPKGSGKSHILPERIVVAGANGPGHR
jgi:hypothetical protein